MSERGVHAPFKSLPFPPPLRTLRGHSRIMPPPPPFASRDDASLFPPLHSASHNHLGPLSLSDAARDQEESRAREGRQG